MNNSLLLDGSTIFKNANLIDNIRQTCIDLHSESNEEEVKKFLKEAQTYLENDLEENVAYELFSTIISSFVNYPTQLLPFFEENFKYCRKNSNYTIITALVLSRLTQIDPKLTLPDYQSFVNDALNEILPQIQKKDNEGLVVFGHQISPVFRIDLIVNLLLSSPMKGKLVSKFLPSFSSRDLVKTNPSLVLLFDDISKSGLIHIQPQTDESRQELIEFITKQDIYLIPKMSDIALSFIEFCSIFITSHNNEMLKELTKETVLPFIAVIFSFMKINHLDFKFSEINIANLLWEGAKYLETVNSPLLNASINFIISNYALFDKFNFMSFNEVLQMLSILIQQLIRNQYKADDMILLFATFDISNNKYYLWDVKYFFQKNGNDIFAYIFKHLYDINRFDNYKERLSFPNQSLNLQMIDCIHITFQIIKMPYDDMLHALFFIRHFCTGRLTDECLQKIAEILDPIIHEHVKNKKWDEILFMVQFMKKYGFIEKIKDLKKDELPENIGDLIFGYTPVDANSIDELLSHILDHPHPEKDDSLFKLLFDMMIKDKDLLNGYINYSVAKYQGYTYSIKSFLKIYLDEFKDYQTELMDAVNNQFYFNEKDDILIRRPDFELSSIAISEYGISIVNKIYEAIGKKTDCFQAFMTLKNIANCFPFLFLKNPQQVFDIVLPFLDNIVLIAEKHLNNERIQLFKTSFSALSFLLSTFQATMIQDKFIQKIFTNIEKFTLPQIFCFIVVLRATFSVHLSLTNIPVWIVKYNVFEIMGKLLERNDIPKNSFGFDFKENIYLFLVDAFNQFLIYTKSEVLQKDEYIKLDTPLKYAFETSYSTFPWKFKHISVFFFNKFALLDEFMNESQQESTFWLSYDIAKLRKENPTSEQMKNFISKLNESHKIIPSYRLPSIPKQLTVRMVRYLVMKSALVYLNILYSESIPLVQETFDMTSKIINDLIEMKEKAVGSNDEADIDMDSFDANDLLLKLYDQHDLFQSLIHQVTLQVYDNTRSSSINDVFHAIANSDNGLHLILKSISQKLTDIYKNRLITDSDSLFNSMHRLIDDISKFSKVKGFTENFFELCGNNLLDIMLSPDWRSNQALMLEVAKLFYTIDIKLPIRTTQFIGFLFLLKSQESIMAAFKLCPHFTHQQLEFITPLIVGIFDIELSKEKPSPELAEYLDLFPSISRDRKDKLVELLSKTLEEFSKADIKDEQTLTLITKLFNSLAPNREEEEVASTEVVGDSVVPQYIMAQSPDFWKLYDKYHDTINEVLKKDPYQLKQFKFLLDYPEIVSLPIRSEYFRRIKNSELSLFKKQTIHVKRDDILNSTIDEFQNLTTHQLMHGFYIQFENEKIGDVDEKKKEWLTMLTKEIFDEKTGLFACTEKDKTYLPDIKSSSIENYLQYFQLVGQIVAVALINGIKIDAHFTASFRRLILYQPPKFEDLEEVDAKLYKSLNWILHNDVDSLNMYFVVDLEELGVKKMILLKNDGDKIKVTNENKNEYVHLRTKYLLEASTIKQLKAFHEGFDSLITFDQIRIFSPDELDLLLCGIPTINVDDIKANTVIEEPLTNDSPVVKFFFNVISKWNNENLAKLMLFVTGSSRSPAVTNSKLTIKSGGPKTNLPQAHTCSNILCLPEYESEEELNENLLQAFEIGNFL